MKQKHPMMDKIEKQLNEERLKLVDKPPKKRKIDLQIILLLSILSGLILAILKIVSFFR